ncbi:MAG: DNA replication/repair protein RecF [Actinomycetota bacterium]|jgi:DNA replication and repair protein RecF|nr:DNA replication/repair protein RecF [Actinomycetota bacterium]
MQLRALELVDFRSYAQVRVELESGGSLFVGPNGEGKTNLVEAVGYLATLGSHRVAADAPLVRHGAERAVLRAVIARADRESLLELELNPGRANRARLNRAPVPRPREVLGTVRTVLFAPEDLALVKGDPAERRRFLDELLVARAPRLAAVRADYDRVLRQRNALLKTAGLAVRAGGGDLRTLDVWDAHLARTGAELLGARLELVAALAPLVDKAYAAVSGGRGPTTLEYRSSRGEGDVVSTDRQVLAAALSAALAAARRSELERGVTLVGPHRDELALGIGELPARGYASHGESWSLALALRLASYELLRGEGPADGEPVLVLDDVFAELDVDRRTRLAELVGGAEQVLVTAAVAADVPDVLAGARFDVAAGAVRRVC